MRRRASWRITGVAVVVAALAASCGVEAGDSVASPSAEERSGGDELSGAEVLAAMRDSVALVETPVSSGSSVLLADGYLLTNAHVVDPFTAVDITFEGAETQVDVPVVGVDLVADLAVVGPVTSDREPPPMVDPILLEPGSDVYLVGFPGDQREQEVTLARGVISRTRTAEPWGLEYLQTDTIIGGGQSGGALVDTSGRVVGISGLEDGDGFAYSLSGADVLARLDDLVDGGERDWEPVPTAPKATEFTVTPQEYWPTALYLPYVAEDVELKVTVPDGTAVAFAEPGWLQSPWSVNEAGSEVDESDYWSASDAEVIDAEDGTLTYDVFAGSDAVVVLTPPEGADSVEVRTNLELVEIDVTVLPEPVAIGESRDGVLNRLDEWVVYELEMEAGESVEIAARSANGDMGWDAVGADVDPSDVIDRQVVADDGGGGLFDLDAVDTYTADTDGTQFIFVYNYDDTAIAYQLTVSEA